MARSMQPLLNAVRNDGDEPGTRIAPLARDQPPMFVASALSRQTIVSSERAGFNSLAPATISESSGSPHSSARHVSLGVAPYKPKHRTRFKSARRREQCRVNQARYRRRQSEREVELLAAVETTRAEIQGLIAHQQRLCDPRVVTTRPTPWHTLARLFDLLRSGLTTAPHEAKLSKPTRAQQLEFVTMVVHEHLRMGDSRGRQALLDQLERFSTFFGDLSVVLCHVREVHADGVTTTLHQTIRLELTITPDTIQHVFPQLQFPTMRALQRKLVGQRLSCDVQGVTVFDAMNHIVEVTWTIDFASALCHFLSLRETAEVLHHARIERDAFLLAPAPMSMYKSDRSVDGSSAHRWYLWEPSNNS